jgi:hypothetical protein
MEAKELKATASLPELLKILGHRPEQQHGQELIYKMGDGKPRFAVNSEHNIWYDHDTRKGGNIIDFAMTYWKLTFREALKKLNEHFDRSQLPAYGKLVSRRRHAQKLPHYRLQNTSPPGTNPEITLFLREKCVWQAAQSIVSEVNYYVRDEKNHIKFFFGAGLENELGHWHISSPNFNDCLGHKAISFIQRSAAKVAIFQNIIDYLSWQTDNQDSDDSILVTHSDDLLLSAIRKIKDFLTIDVYFSHDNTGRLQSAELIQALPQATDRSALYQNHSHYNEWLCVRTRVQRIPIQNR